MEISKIFDWKDGQYNVVINTNCESFVTILNSSRIRDKRRMKEVIDWICSMDFGEKIIPNKKSAIREWKAHNLLHDLDIKKEHTQHVDFTLDQSVFEKIGYFILSLLYVA